MRRTTLPFSTVSSPTGSVRMTVFSMNSVENSETISSSSPARASWTLASVTSLPIRLGISTSPRPTDTVRVMIVPCGRSSVLGTLWRMTTSLATSSLTSSSRSTVKPAALRISSASPTGRPSTEGTRTTPMPSLTKRLTGSFGSVGSASRTPDRGLCAKTSFSGMSSFSSNAMMMCSKPRSVS